MTVKQKILRLVDRMPEDITLEQAVHRIMLLSKVEEGLADARAGRWIDHDELFDRLEKEDEETQAALDAKGGNRSSRAKEVHRPGRPKNGKIVRETAKAVRK